MKKKKFSLESVLKIREFAEQQRLQEFAHAAKQDYVLVSKINNLTKQQEALAKKLADEHDFSVIRIIYDDIALCEERKVEFSAEREKIKENIQKKKEKYEQEFRKAESIRILEKKHVKEQKKEWNKEENEKNQENMIWKK